jgi:hypothetical protein
MGHLYAGPFGTQITADGGEAVSSATGADRARLALWPAADPFIWWRAGISLVSV